MGPLADIDVDILIRRIGGARDDAQARIEQCSRAWEQGNRAALFQLIDGLPAQDEATTAIRGRLDALQQAFVAQHARDPVHAHVLYDNRAFVDRSALRSHLSSLLLPSGPRILVVTGEDDSGKSFPYFLIAHIFASRTTVPGSPRMQLAYCDLADMGDSLSEVTPKALGATLLKQLGADPSPTTNEENAREYRNHADAVLSAVKASECVSWIVIDGYNKSSTDPLDQMMNRLANGLLKEPTISQKCRLVLLDYPVELWMEGIGAPLRKVILSLLGDGDVRDFFTSYYGGDAARVQRARESYVREHARLQAKYGARISAMHRLRLSVEHALEEVGS